MFEWEVKIKMTNFLRKNSLKKGRIPTYLKVDDSLTNLTSRYNATVGLVDIMESSITTTITRYFVAHRKSRMVGKMLFCNVYCVG